MKEQILYLLISLLIIITFQKEEIGDKIISEIYVQNYNKLKFDFNSDYISEIEKLNIPTEYKEWVKKVNLEKKETKNELTVKYTKEKGGYAQGKFASISKIGKTKKKVSFKYGSVEASLRPLNDEDINEERVKRLVEKIMKNEIKKKLSNKGKNNNNDLNENTIEKSDVHKKLIKNKKKINKYDIDNDEDNDNDVENLNKKKKIKKIKKKKKMKMKMN